MVRQRARARRRARARARRPRTSMTDTAEGIIKSARTSRSGYLRLFIRYFMEKTRLSRALRAKLTDTAEGIIKSAGTARDGFNGYLTVSY